MYLNFPWGASKEVLNPSDLTPRQRKYLQWVLNLHSRTQRLHLLYLLGFLNYQQAKWSAQRTEGHQEWP